jgi:hypothetical protein
VVDVHVQHPALEQRVEVGRRVVAVERDLGVELLVELPERGELRGQQDRERRPLTHDERAASVAEDEADRLLAIEQLQDGEPLGQLVDVGRAVAEVGEDGQWPDVPVRAGQVATCS